jgi:hypothetical protein
MFSSCWPVRFITSVVCTAILSTASRLAKSHPSNPPAPTYSARGHCPPQLFERYLEANYFVLLAISARPTQFERPASPAKLLGMKIGRPRRHQESPR